MSQFKKTFWGVILLAAAMLFCIHLLGSAEQPDLDVDANSEPEVLSRTQQLSGQPGGEALSISRGISLDTVPHIVSTSPAQNELNVLLSANISVTFDVDMDETTINDSTFVVNARSTGLHLGTITYDGQSKTATFDPLEDFDVGEVVTVVLTTGIQSSGGAPLDNSYAWSFTLVVNDGSGVFVPDSVYPVRKMPESVFAADLDSDGDLDLATANVNGCDVSALLNNGNGTFASHLSYSVGCYPVSVFAADLDGDGDLDLASANFGPYDNVSVLLNKGDGTFAPRSVYPVGDNPRSVFAADLDGDGELDLATANESSNNVSVLLNNGDGTFTPHLVYAVGDGPYSVFAADLDGDGDLDLATANFWSNNVSVLLNIGDGTFASHLVYPLGSHPFSVFAADFDGDGDLDLATANSGSNNVSVVLNHGDGTFAPHSVYPAGYYSCSVFASDVDGDGDLDLATANRDSDNVSLLLNNGDGTFASQSVYEVDSGPHSVFAGDLDRDGDLDLTTANYSSDNVSVLNNFAFREVLVTPGPHISGSAKTDVTVEFYIENTGDSPDIYDVNVTDSLGWEIAPLYYEVALDTSQVDSVSFTVSIPNVPIGTTDRIFVTAVSQADTSVCDSASLAVTCDAYNVQIAAVSDVGNDQGKQVHIDWSSFPGADPLVTDFSIFRRKDSLLMTSPTESVISPDVFSRYPPGIWEWLVTIPAFGETLYSAVVPTLKDSTVAEGMYWSVFFVRAGTDNPILYFDSPVDSGYSLDDLSPSPPVGLLASHEPAVTKLAWNATSASDFDYYTLYRDTLSGFTPDPGNRLGFTIDTTFVDSTAELGRTCYYLVSATDFSGNESDPSNEAIGVRYVTGDATGDGETGLSDVVYVINYVLKGGDSPVPVQAGDVNCDTLVDLVDMVYLINYLFRGGPPPCQ